MNSVKVGHVIFFTGGTIALYLLVRRLAHSQSASPLWTGRGSRQQCPAPESPRRPPRRTEGVSLRQVHPSPENEITTDIDIIAIHGLDTNSSDTWIWKPKGADISKEAWVNWLEDQHMLPKKAEQCRIFMCDWPAPLLEKSNLVQKRIEEFARLLLDGIVNRHSATNERPIVFIASCLGGVILMQALVMASDEYLSVRRATRGIVFLATPFQGTSFQDVANWADPGLRAWALMRRKRVTKLLDHVKGSTFDLAELVSRFTQLCKDKDHPYQVFTFYEMGYTDLYSKVFPWLPFPLQSKQVKSRKMAVLALPLDARKVTNARQLVDKTSATLQIVPHPLPLDRPHVTMNKFFGPDDKEYISVAGKIESILREIREGRPIDKADAWIRKRHYTEDKLQIVRLSGDRLSMDQCYINLAIVEQRGEKDGASEKRDAQRSSPFSLAARLKVATPDKDSQVELSTLFNPREGPDGRMIDPRRILIRGRAGVGKTTLCKKMVYDFIYNGIGKAMFDRILWVPLRNLKREPKEGYTLEGLFLEEYFSQDPKGKDLAHGLWVALDAIKYRKTLFVLDGLDEVSEGLDENNKMLKLLQRLLTLPAVIVTSRPHASLPHWLKGRFDLELETIGFHPDQVKTYVEKAFINPETGEPDPEMVGDIQSFLQHHQVVQDLVRIPIQLDALCFIWSDRSSVSRSEPKLETMTAVYRAIEYGLWKKDVLNLEKEHGGKRVSLYDIENAEMDDIENLVGDEICLIEGLAFTGLLNDAIEFGREHQSAVSKLFRHPTSNILLDKTLPRLSFLRTSDPLSKDCNYHFLHLTFQEYFAARYFVRQWKAGQPLKCLTLSNRKHSQIEPVDFLQRHKYHARYDIMWRFVAGLLDAEEGTETLRFFQQIEEEPHDLLGPTHQRLIMHCLSEVGPQTESSIFTPFRTKLYHQLSEWLLFEFKFREQSQLVDEMELPQQVLVEALQKASEDTKIRLLVSLKSRPGIPSIMDQAAVCLVNNISQRLCLAILDMLGHRHEALPSKVLKAITARLEDDDSDIRLAAVKALQGQSALPEDILKAVAARLEHNDNGVREAAVEALQGQSALPEEILKAISARLEDNKLNVRWAAVRALQDQVLLPEEILKAVAARLKHNDDEVRVAAVDALQGRSVLPEEILKDVAAQLEHSEWIVRWAAVKAFQGQSALPEEILMAVAARLEDNDSDVREAAVEALQGQSTLPEEILKAVSARLEHNDSDVRWAAVGALQRQPTLPEEILKAVTARLDHNDIGVKDVAAKALQGQPDLPEEILKAVAARLEHNDSNVRWVAVLTLQSQWALPEEILNAVAARLEDNDSNIREAAVEALQRQSALPEEILKAVAARLEDNECNVRWAAVKALQGQPAIPEEILKAVAARLEDDNRKVRHTAVLSLQDQSALPEEIIKTIVARLEDNEWDVRWAAVEALQSQSTLPEEILKAVATRLEHNDSDVRWTAVGALQGQPILPEGILKAVAARLDDNDSTVRGAAVKVLQDQSTLPEEIFNAVAARLEDESYAVRGATIKALQGQSALPEEVFKAIAARLGDRDSHVREAAVEALQSWSALPEEILKAVAARLEHNDSDIRRTAVEALRGQPDLPEEILKAVAAKLGHKDSNVKCTAFKALQGQSALPEEILKAVAAKLEDNDSNVRGAAVEALQGQSALPEEILKAVSARLEDNEWNIRWAAILILQGQSDLPEEILKAIVARLEDDDSDVRRGAVLALIDQSTIPLKVLYQHIQSLYKALLERSFTEHVSCYVTSRVSYLVVGNREIPLEGQQGIFKEAIQETQRDLGIPLLNSLAG